MQHVVFSSSEDTAHFWVGFCVVPSVHTVCEEIGRGREVWIAFFEYIITLVIPVVVLLHVRLPVADCL